MAFSLIQEDTFYKKVVTNVGEYWEDGVLFPGTVTITYETFEGLTDSYQKGESSTFDTSGVSNSEMLSLFTSETLKTHQSLPQGSNLADIVYLSNPETDSTAVEYTVWDKAKFNKNQGFTLIDGNCPEYLLVREVRT